MKPRPHDPTTFPAGDLAELVDAFVAAHPGDRAVAELARLVLHHRLAELAARRGDLTRECRQPVEVDPDVAHKGSFQLTIVH